MGFPLAKEGGDGGSFKPVSAGLHPAVCVGVIDFGIQEGSDQFPKPKHKLHLRWACTDEIVEWEKDGQKHRGPAIVGATYTYTLSDKGNLRGILEGWRGRAFTEKEREGFDVSSVAGKPCQVNVIHVDKGGKTYANVQSVVGWPKGIQVPSIDTPIVVYSPSVHDPVTYNDLPKWMRETIDKRLANTYAELDAKTPEPEPEPGQHAGTGIAADHFDDDIPF